MSEPSKALPREWVERIFLRFLTVYGDRLRIMWGQVERESLIAAWADELAGFEGTDIAFALDATRRTHTDNPPNLYQFAGLCRDGREKRRQGVRRMAERFAVPDAAALERLRTAAASALEGRDDPKAWARKIVQRHEQCDRSLPHLSLEMAREALGLSA